MAYPLGIPIHAAAQPDKIAIVDDEGKITFRELQSRVNRWANAFRDLGVGPDDKVSVLLHNSGRFLEAVTALGKLGATPVAINYRFKSEEVLYVANHSESKVLVFGPEFLPVIAPIQKRLEGVRHLVVTGDLGEPPPFAVRRHTDLLAASSEAEPQGGPADGVSASLIYTSGTTGRSKGCFKTSRRRLATLLQYIDLYNLTPDDVHLLTCPIYHSAPYAFGVMSLLLGNTVIIHSRFDPLLALQEMNPYKVTTAFMVPTQFNRIVNLPAEQRAALRPTHLRVLVVGAAPIPFPLKAKTVEFFGEGKLYEFYGATETGMNTLLYPHEQLTKPGSCGRAIPGNDIRLLDEKGNEVPQGEIGELFVKSDLLLDGYYKMPEETAKRFRDGYFSVGDLARVDEDGYYYILDRKVDMVISGGVNIYPVEIEELLYRHPKIYDAAVIGVKDEDWGERLVAYVVLKEGQAMTAAEVQAYVGEHLADYKKPREVHFAEALPYSPQGKLLKRELRRQYEAEHGQPVR